MFGAWFLGCQRANVYFNRIAYWTREVQNIVGSNVKQMEKS